METSPRKRKPLPFDKVTITDDFWAQRIAANRERGLFAVYQQLRNTGRLEAYKLNWKPGGNQPAPHVFWDSDVAKWLEGACYSLITHPDDALAKKVDEVVDLILSAQGEDGYLNPHFTVVNPKGRWTNLRDHHELYCAGHLIESAIAHHRATGDPHFLDSIQRYADLIDRVFGPGENQLYGYPGHEEIELALIKLYRYTGEKRYLDLAQYFIETRGQSPHYFEAEARQRGEDPVVGWAEGYAHYQAHRPVREQQQVVGHAVRAMYLYCGMADLATELNDQELLHTLKVLWEDLVAHKLYLTGGIGSSRTNEGFTRDYDLPNTDAYAETCAAIGLVFWAQCMLQVDLDSRYADIMERALYNGVLSGVSLRGDQFFYVNPLASDGGHHRQTFYTCSCCPPNINRLLPTVGGYIYSQGDAEIALHLYIQSKADFVLNGEHISLIQETDYPWDGIVCIRFEIEQPIDFTLKLRYPGWCREGRVYLNSEPVECEPHLKQGYISLSRTWHSGDQLRLQWVMPVNRVYAHPEVRSNVGSVALMRGPLVYCFESADQDRPLASLRLPREARFDSQFVTDLLGGVVTIHGTGRAVDAESWGQKLYRSESPSYVDTPFTAIPYYTWDNRQPGAMRVWLPEVCA